MQSLDLGRFSLLEVMMAGSRRCFCGPGPSAAKGGIGREREVDAGLQSARVSGLNAEIRAWTRGGALHDSSALRLVLLLLRKA